MSGTTPKPRKRDLIRRLISPSQKQTAISSSSPSPLITPNAGGTPSPPLTQSPQQSRSALALQYKQDFLASALKLLTVQEQATINDNLLGGAHEIESALDGAYKAAAEKQELCEAKRWTWTVGGKVIGLRDEADKVMLWLDRFKTVGDIAVNADPVHAGLPWAGIRLVLEVRIRRPV